MIRHIDLIITCQTIAYAKLISIGIFIQQSHRKQKAGFKFEPCPILCLNNPLNHRIFLEYFF